MSENLSKLRVEVDADSGITSLNRYEQAAQKSDKASQLLDRAVKKGALAIDLLGSSSQETARHLETLRALNERAGTSIQRRAEQAEKAAQAAERAALAEQAETQRLGQEMARTEEQAYRMNAAMQKSSAAFGLGETGANRLRSSLTGLLTPLLQTTGSANVLVSTLGSLALGNAVTVGILGGLAAIAVAYDAITASARATEKATADAIKASDELRKRQRQGSTGDLPEQTRTLLQEQTKATKDLLAAEKQLRELRNAPSYGAAKTGIGGADEQAAAIARTASRIKDIQDRIATNQREINRVLTETNAEYSQKVTDQLVAVVRSGAATVAETEKLRDRLQNLKSSLSTTVKPEDRARMAEDITQITELFDKQARAAERAGKAEAKSVTEYNRQRIEAEQIIARIEANELQQDRLKREASDKARAGIADSIVARQRDIDVMREQIAQLQGNANAYDALAEARAEEKAVAEARAKLPKDDTLDPETERKIRGQVQEYYELSKALKFAQQQRAALDQWNGKNPFDLKETVDKSISWADALRDVAGVAQLIATTFGATGKELGNLANGTQSIASGLARAAQIKNAAGEKVGLGGALSGQAGAAGVLAGLGSVGAIAGGAFQIAEALDLFGNRARERARQLEELARQFNDALDNFAITSRTSLEDAIRQNAAKAADLARQAAAASGGTFTGSFKSSVDISQLVGQLQAAADQSKFARAAFGPFIDRLRELEAVTKENERALKERNETEIAGLSKSYDVRTLRAAGLSAEADELAAVNAAIEEATSVHEKYKDAALDSKLATLQMAEAAKRAADAAKEAARLKEEERRRIFDVTNDTRSISDPRGAAQAAFDEEQQRKYNDAVARGASETELAAIALNNLARAAQRAADIAEADNRATEGLMNRVFAALGNSRTAQDAATFTSQRQELADAVKEGMTPSNLALLRFTQFVEREQIGLQRRIEDGTKAIQETAKKNIELKDAESAAEQARVALSQQAFEGQIAAVKATSDDQIAALGNQRGVLEGILDSVRSQLQTAQEELRVSERAYEALSSFSDSLKLSAASPLSPTAKLAEAQAQFERLAREAQGGNANSASAFPAAAQAFLEASRNVNASGSNYASDFSRVQQITEQLTAQYGSRFGAAQGNVATLQALLDSTQTQIDAIDATKSTIKEAAEAQIALLQAAKEADKASSDALLDKLNTQKQAISDGVQAQIDALVKAETQAFNARIEASAYYADWKRLTEQQMAAAEEFYRQASEYFAPTTATAMPVIIESGDSIPTSDPELKNVVAELKILVAAQDAQITELKAQVKLEQETSKQTLLALQGIRDSVSDVSRSIARAGESGTLS